MRDAVALDALPEAPLSRLRLLIALDALLVTGSVSGAAAALSISTPAASRLLAQLRQLFGDEILLRSGRGMVPTPLAEGLRLRVRALAAEAEAILRDPVPLASESVTGVPIGFVPTVAAPVPAASPPLALRSTAPLEGEPSDAQVRARLEQIGADHEPVARLGRYIATIGAGQGRSRPLTLEEAEDAFAILLEGEAEGLQIGALLTLLQYRGITPAELAGMVRACRRGLPPPGQFAVDVDWPAYFSPFNRNPPWFLLAAKLLGQTGRRVVLHGLGPGLSPYDAVLEALGIPRAADVAEAGAALASPGAVFLPLPAIHPQIQALINLYGQFQMRTPIQLGLQLLNPLSAPATLMGLPRATLPMLHREAAGLIGGGRLLCIDSHRDVAQATPHRLMRLALSDEGAEAGLVMPPQVQARAPSPPPGFTTAQHCAAVWRGQLRSPEAEATVTDTLALALIATGDVALDVEAARLMAQDMWQERDRELA